MFVAFKQLVMLRTDAPLSTTPDALAYTFHMQVDNDKFSEKRFVAFELCVNEFSFRFFFIFDAIKKRVACRFRKLIN